jgi:DNA-binding LacI/PurR family transcriptional regulator
MIDDHHLSSASLPVTFKRASKNLPGGPSVETSKRKPSIRMIAELGGVCSMTVSLALRNAPKISIATRERVHEIARELGYRPDPQVAKLMCYLRNRKKPQYKSTICALTTSDLGHFNFHATGIVRGARERAEGLGFGLDVIHIDDLRPSRRDIQRILKNRGVEGILLLPMANPRDFTDLIDWPEFSVLAATHGVLTPEFHRVVPQQFGNTLILCAELRRLGYRRIGLVLPKPHDLSVHHGFTGGVAWQNIFCDTESVFPCLYNKEERSVLRTWFGKHKPDVIITAGEDDEGTVARELGLAVPGPVGFVAAAVDLARPNAYAGIVERSEEIGARSIDLLSGMILRGEKGIPGVPTITTVEGCWYSAPSVQAAT